MDFSAVNWLAVIIAAVVAWLFGAAWYMGLSKPWLKAAKLDPATMSKSPLPFVISFIAEIVMALVMSLVIGAMTGGEPSLVAGLVFGFVLWLGFVATTLSVNPSLRRFRLGPDHHRLRPLAWRAAHHWRGDRLVWSSGGLS